jgi:hypothetical protein
VASCGWTGALPAAASTVASSQPSAPILPHSKIRRGAQGLPLPSTRPLTSGNCSTLFTAVASPNATAINVLESAAAIFPTDIWSVGFSNTGASSTTPDRTLAEHWNGTTWTRVATPNLGTGHNDLTAVAAHDPNDVWAVGLSEATGSSILKNLALHWNGSAWAAVTTPSPSTLGQFLTGVSAVASNNVWAVGFDVSGSQLVTMVLHWNGSSWVRVVSPNPGLGDNILQSVFALSASDVWAVGQYQPTAGASVLYQTVVEHWDGTSWTVATSANPVTGEDILLNVSASSPTDAWAVGYTDTGGTSPTQTLIEHWDGTSWTTVASPNIATTGDNLFFGVVAISSTNAWASGFGRADNTLGGATLAEHWDGTAWTIQTSDSPGVNGNELTGLAALPGNDVWAVGDAAPASGDRTLIEQFQLPAPTSVAAGPGNQSASVSWTPPVCDGGFTTTSYVVTAADGCTIQASQAGASSPLVFGGLTNGTAFNFTVQAVSASLGAETPSAPSAAVIPNGTSVEALSACSTVQYSYANPNPSTFADMDATRLKLQFTTPSVASLAVITGNADLFTATAGVNQDIGIDVNGSLVAWKESGGFAGTFSPNAAAVQTVVPLTASTAYTVKLQWKSNKAVAGSKIYAGAGPLEGDYRFSASLGYSPTRLSVRIVPVSAATVFSVASTGQYSLTGSNGSTWADIDGANLSLPVTAATDSLALITGNADLFTANAGYNQDIAINVDASIAGWKESGGFGGTFSPNAAFVQAVVPLSATGSPHTIKLQWKTNKPEGTAAIYAGAGPLPSTTLYSPTRLTVVLLPTTPSTDVSSVTSSQQYSLANSDGAGWNVIDSTILKTSFQPGTVMYTYQVSGNADLFTANAGYNQDIGIFISGGVYGNGTLVAWKESGGFAGTFSPNAAYVETVQHLGGNITYTFWLAWKTNKQAAGKTIYAAAGPLPPSTTSFSPTTLTAIELSSP